jgi:hypothetical protein
MGLLTHFHRPFSLLLYDSRSFRAITFSMIFQILQILLNDPSPVILLATHAYDPSPAIPSALKGHKRNYCINSYF